VGCSEDDVTEHLLLALEKIIIEMISAARDNDLQRLHELGEKHRAILNILSA
jgi:hypothetical protein